MYSGTQSFGNEPCAWVNNARVLHKVDMRCYLLSPYAGALSSLILIVQYAGCFVDPFTIAISQQ